MVTCQIRLVSEDVLLETRELDAAPNMGDEVVAGARLTSWRPHRPTSSAVRPSSTSPRWLR